MYVLKLQYKWGVVTKRFTSLKSLSQFVRRNRSSFISYEEFYKNERFVRIGSKVVTASVLKKYLSSIT